MDPKKNPYSPGAGTPPTELAGRDEIPRAGLQSLLPIEGVVLGIDIGWSQVKRSSAVAALSWSNAEIRCEVERFRYIESERREAIEKTANGNAIIAAAFDGPLRRGLDHIGVYRSAERMLTSGLHKFIGKPGQSSSANGHKLNKAANEAAHAVIEHCSLLASNPENKCAIDDSAISEAFPTSFLGVMLNEDQRGRKSKKARSDEYFATLADSGVLSRYIEYFLPARRVLANVNNLQNHDDRAGFVCALTALAVAAGEFTAIGDSVNGWIILPPKHLISEWAWRELEASQSRNGPASLIEIRLGSHAGNQIV